MTAPAPPGGAGAPGHKSGLSPAANPIGMTDRVGQCRGLHALDEDVYGCLLAGGKVEMAHSDGSALQNLRSRRVTGLESAREDS